MGNDGPKGPSGDPGPAGPRGGGGDDVRTTCMFLYHDPGLLYSKFT